MKIGHGAAETARGPGRSFHVLRLTLPRDNFVLLF